MTTQSVRSGSAGFGGGYLRFAALGDSTTAGVGDPVAGAWRGWARLLSESLGSTYDVSFCNLAVSGATSADVYGAQRLDGVAHRPDVASLIVGINDTMRSTWDPVRVRAQIVETAEQLHDVGAVLLTARFHDHGAVFGLPKVLRRGLFRRIEDVNGAYDEVFERFGGVQVDLAHCPEVWAREFWSVDRLHPSELGHRMLARRLGEGLRQLGYEFAVPTLECGAADGTNWRSDVRWLVTEGAPWVGRRARDMGPWAVKMAWSGAKQKAVVVAPARVPAGLVPEVSVVTPAEVAPAAVAVGVRA